MLDIDNSDLGMISLLLFGGICLGVFGYATVKGVDTSSLMTFGLGIAGMIGSLANNKNSSSTTTTTTATTTGTTTEE